MKIKNSNSTIDKVIIRSKIFQSLKVPDRNKRLKELRNNVIMLKNSVGLLNITKNKNKIINKKIKHNYIINPRRASLTPGQYEARRIKKFKSLESFNQKIITNNDDSSLDEQEKEKNILYMDRASLLKRKNKEFLEKVSKKNQDIYTNLFNNNKNDIFMTESNLPSIIKNNGKHNSLRKVYTESNRYYENTINSINNLKSNKNSRNYKIKDAIIRSSSDKRMLPPIRITQENAIKLGSYQNNSISSSEINSEEKSINEKQNENDELNTFKPKGNKDVNLTLESERSNSLKRKKNIINLNNQLKNLFGRQSSNPEIKNLVNKIRQIDINFKNRRFYYELEKWIMSSKFKYAKWRFGVADIDKYFVDMKEFGENEEKELEMRKSFYEKVNLVINELKEDKERRELLNIERKYGIKIDNEEKKTLKDNEYWNEDKANNKMGEICKVLKLTKQRKLKEKEQRNLIEEILFQCKKGVNNINNS